MTRRRSARAMAGTAAAALLCCACGGDSTSGPVDARQFEARFGAFSAAETWLFVVDAGEGPPASELRERFAHDFAEAWAHQCRLDPAAWGPIHRTTVLAYPSSDGAVFVSSEDAPDLEYAANVRSRDGFVHWSEAVSSAITAPPVTTGPNSILATLQDGMGLLAGLRSPTTPGEEALSLSAEATTDLILSIVSSREDESPGDPSDYAVHVLEPLGRFSVVLQDAIVVPAAANEPCDGAWTPTPRFDAWQSASSTAGLALWQPCRSAGLVQQWAGDGDCHVGPESCVPQPRQLADGQTACRVYVESTTPLPCSEERGWFESTEIGGSNGPVCEVRQLEGPALQACKVDLDCIDCSPGFCFTEVPELSAVCSNAGMAAYPRVIAGTAGGPMPKGFRVVCDGEL